MTETSSSRRLALVVAVGALLALGAWWWNDSADSGATTSDELAGTRTGGVAQLPRIDDGPPGPLAPVAAPAETTELPELRVAVVDPRGLGLGEIPVVLTAAHASSPPRALGRAATGPDGTAARLAVPDALFADGWNAEGALRYSIAVDLPLDGAPQLELTQRPERGQRVELELSPGLLGWLRPLRVRVSDRGGQPVGGVPVTLEVRRDISPARSQTMAQATTRAADGLALLALSELWTIWGTARSMQLDTQVVVRADLPFSPAPTVTIDLSAAPPETVDVVLPPSGWIELQLVGADPAGAGATWRRVDNDTPDAATQHPAVAPMRLGPLGLGWLVETRVRIASGAVEVVDLEGPTRPGQVVSAEIRFGQAPRSMSFRGKAVTPAGDTPARLCVAALRPAATPGGRTVSSDFVRTGADGQFRYDASLNTDAAAQLAAGTLELALTVVKDFPDDPTLEAVARLAGALPADGVWKLGTLVMTAPAPIDGAGAGTWNLSGRVVDESGRGIHQAAIELYGEPEGDDLRGPRLARGRSDDGGAFLLTDLPPAATRWTVTAGKIGFVANQLPGFGDQASPVELVLQSAGRIEGRVLVDGDVPLDMLRVTLQGGPLGRSANLADFGGAFRFESLAPGEYQVGVGVHGSDWILRRVANVLVQAGLTAADPRMTAIDARGSVRRLELELVDDRRPVSSRRIALVDDDGAAARDLVSSETGRLATLVPAGVQRFSLRVPGYRPVVITWQAGPLVVPLQRE